MKRFLLKVLLFFAIVVVIDITAGVVGDYLQTHAKGGYTRLTNDFALKDTHDVLIFGSSRAKHHYDTPFMSDTLGLDVYNVGYNGCGSILAAGLMELALERYKPQLIIYDVTFSFDIYENLQDNNNVRYIKWLKPYFRDKKISDIIRHVSTEEWFKVHSGLIRYNSGLVTMAQDFVISSPMRNQGYEPMNGILSVKTNEDESIKKEEPIYAVDSLKLYYIQHIIDLANSNGVPIVFVKSPRYGVYNSDIIQPIKDICFQSNVPFLDYRSNEEFQIAEYYSDASHLNADGARRFTQNLLSEDIIVNILNCRN